MNKLLLKSVMAANGVNQKDLAGIVGCTNATMSSKITGKTEFTISEATKIRKALCLDSDQAVQIFLS